MIYDDYNYNNQLINSNGFSGDTTWIIISAVLAIVGGIAAYFLFVSKKNNGEYTGFVAWLHDFLNFKIYFINAILKITYIIAALLITLSSFSLIGSSVAGFFVILIFGNVFLRLSYEFILMLLTVVNNTTEINKKMTSVSTEKKETKPKKKETTKDSEEEE